MITLAHLKTILHYSPETGDFQWLAKKQGRRLNGVVGSINGNGYKQICIDGKPYQAHRLAWFYVYGCWPPNKIDHINRNQVDNRLINLRCVDDVMNQQNRKLNANNKSGMPGVCWHINKSKWLSQIKHKGKMYFLGYFDNLFDAACARKSADNKFKFHQNHGRII